MNRIVSVIFVLLLVLCGCRKEEETSELPEARNAAESYLLSLPDKPSSDDLYFLVTNGGLVNEDLWEDFVDKCEQEKEAEITFGQYTIEGDLIYTLLSYDGDHFQATVDNSRDQFGKPQFFEYEGKHLNYFVWTTMEEYSDGVHPALNHVACLSDEVFDDAEELVSRLREGDPDVVLLWTDQTRADR